MAEIREKLVLEDKFSSQFGKFISLASTSASSAAKASAAVQAVGQAARASAQGTQAMSSALNRQTAQEKAAEAATAGTAAAIKDKTAQELRASQTGAGRVGLINRLISALRGQTKQEKSAAQAAQTAASAYRQEEGAARAAQAAQNKTANATDQLTKKLGVLIGQYLTLRSIHGILNLADELAQTTARLDMMNDGLQTTAQLNNMIFESAQRSRGAYADTADLVAKLGNLAGSAFSSSREIVAFAEQLNKQLALSGASAAGAQAAILQLTQALSSGVLRGEELNSVLEQAPTVAQTIAKYLGVTTGQMRELASQGALTADVVKNALFSAADETNAKFAQMPMTFSQIWTQFQNQAIKAFQPVLAKMTELANSPQFQQFVSMMLQGITMIANAALEAFGWIANIANAIASNWSTVGPIFYGVAAAIGVVVTAMAAWKAATLAVAAAQAVLNLALSHPVLMVVALLIGVVIAAIARWVQAMGGLQIAWMIACDVIQTAWGYLVYYISVGIVAVQNWLGDFALAWQSVGVAIADYMGQTKVNVLMILQDLVNGAIDIINQFIALLNNLPGVSIEAIGGVTFGAAAALEEGVKSSMRNSGLGMHAAVNVGLKAQRQAWLAGQLSDVKSGHASRQQDIFLSKVQTSIEKGVNSASGVGGGAFSDIYSTAAGAGGLGGAVDGIGNSVGGSLGSDVGGIKKEVQMAQEDLKYLVDMAERQYVNKINLTSQTPIINVSGQNTGNNANDRRALANALKEILAEQKAAASIRSTALPTVG